MAPINNFEISLSEDKTQANLDCEQNKLAGSFCVFGVFDGLHLGHQKLFNIASEKASIADSDVSVLTFDIDPDELFSSHSHTKLMDNKDRLNALAKLDVNSVNVINFNTDVAELDPELFLNSAFAYRLPLAIVVGENFHFGKGAKGSVDTLKKWGEKYGVDIIAIPLLQIEGSPVSSSRIRSLLREGKIEEANFLLGKDCDS